MPKFRTLRNKIDRVVFKAHSKIISVKRGDIAFEYVIILVIMAGVIFVGWNLLGNMVMQKINEISGVLENTHAY